MSYIRGIMDGITTWETEDEFFKYFQLKNDSYTFCEIYESGYEEFYLDNRLILKNSDVLSYVYKKIDDIKKSYYTDSLLLAYHPKEEAIKNIEKNIKLCVTEYLAVIGFIYLKYQLTIPQQLKLDILNTVNQKIEEHNNYLKDNKDQDQYNCYYIDERMSLQYFNKCIEKEDGEGLTNIGSILPKRTLYD